MQNTKDLLHGNIKKELIAMMLPLIAGNILQQLYNTIDSLIVGRYVGNNAFAAVGVAGSVMNLFIFMINGGCNGISVIFADLYGRREWRLLKKESFWSLVIGLGSTLILSLLGISFLSPVLRLLSTPDEILHYTHEYLFLILLGLPVTFLYNWCASMLQAAGDTRTPLLVLLTAMCLNTILDLIFVAGMNLETMGSAVATVISQLMATFLCLIVMHKKHPEFFFQRADLIPDRMLIKKTASFAAISAFHQSSLYIGKLLVQGAVNAGGTDIISAYTASTRIEGFINSFSDSGGIAISVFVAQNLGAGNKKRAKSGFTSDMTIMLSLAVVLSLLMIFLNKSAVMLLMKDPSAAVLKNANEYMVIISFFYFLCYIGSTFVGLFRGMGKLTVPVTATIIQITIRVIFSYLWIQMMGLKAVAIATGLGWSAIGIYYYISYRMTARNLISEDHMHSAAMPSAMRRKNS